jgi:hypothetical protein
VLGIRARVHKTWEAIRCVNFDLDDRAFEADDGAGEDFGEHGERFRRLDAMLCEQPLLVTPRGSISRSLPSRSAWRDSRRSLCKPYTVVATKPTKVVMAVKHEVIMPAAPAMRPSAECAAVLSGAPAIGSDGSPSADSSVAAGVCWPMSCVGLAWGGRPKPGRTVKALKASGQEVDATNTTPKITGRRAAGRAEAGGGHGCIGLSR